MGKHASHTRCRSKVAAVLLLCQINKILWTLAGQYLKENSERTLSLELVIYGGSLSNANSSGGLISSKCEGKLYTPVRGHRSQTGCDGWNSTR